MATTSVRALTLLSLLAARQEWTGAELTARLGVSDRTLRRDLGMLRELGYPVKGTSGPAGGYRLGAGSTLPPLQFDDEQAVAVALALQTVPGTVAGVAEGAARALATLRQVLPVPLQAAVDAVRTTSLWNPWEFAAPPVAPGTLRAVGEALRRGHLLRVEVVSPDGRRRQPGEEGFVPPVRVEPHDLLVWASRWYLVAHDPDRAVWVALRVDRLHVLDPTGTPFTRRPLPDDDVARWLTTRVDRGDTPAAWPCLGTVRMHLPAAVVAPWLPGGAVVADDGPAHCRVTLGAWSWAGVAGLLATFDADISEVQPAELRTTMRVLARRWDAAGA